MRVPLCANDVSMARPGSHARAALLGASLVVHVVCGAMGCGDDPPPRAHDAGATHDASPLDAPVDGELHDGGPPLDADAGAGSYIIDGGVATGCPPWQRAPADRHGWLHVRAVSKTGAVLTPDAVDIFVRRVNEPLPGERAEPNDPCAVASYEQSATKVLVLAAAIGFSSQQREFSPGRCVEASPCSVELPQSLNGKYYQTQDSRMSLRAADDLPQSERTSFASEVAKDALARSKALRRPLAQELDEAARATKVPAVDLAIRYAETRLARKCDARCLDDRRLDASVRKYLKAVPRPRADPFELRTPPEKWRTPPR
jgi:hypothetical protein